MPFSPKVLIVEDDAIIIYMLKTCYEYLGCEVLGAVDSGEASLEFLKNTSVDLISMDILLSTKMTGIDAMSVARDMDINTPVIFVSASNDYEEKTKTFSNSLFLRKPVGLDELAATVQQFFPQTGGSTAAA